jgi:hypothetical protein
MMEPRNWYVVLNMLKALKRLEYQKLEKYWECYQRLVSNPQNLLFIRHDPCNEIFDLSRWLKLKTIIYVM